MKVQPGEVVRFVAPAEFWVIIDGVEVAVGENAQPLAFCDCGARWDHARPDQSRPAVWVLCVDCGEVIACEVCSEDTPATCTHIDYATCARHYEVAVNNVYSRW
jgi:hypothetical protein